MAVLGLLATPVVAQKTIESKPVTISATIESIDKATRVVTLKGPKGNTLDVTAPEDMQGFNTLRRSATSSRRRTTKPSR